MFLRGRATSRFLDIHYKGDSGFWFILISASCLFFGCNSNEQTDKPEATPQQLMTQPADSAEKKFASQIAGRAFFQGEAPVRKLIHMNQDAACATAEGNPAYSEEILLDYGPDSSSQISAEKFGLANVFVYVKTGFPDSLISFFIRKAGTRAPVILDQRGCRYSPHVFGIQVGQTLKILNSDPTFHNVHASAKKNKAFNLGMSKVEKVKTRRFDRAEVMIPFHCNVHPWMSAYAGVVDHPFYAVTDTAGRYALPALPAGEYVIEAWHEVFGTQVQTVKITEAESKSLDFTFTRR
ncbi:MAG: carboxypeptidase regulatory-like domain-containing protein [candidate division KSB1 bacterium]|nr:carboxypeptidase regulatory-like domain-containing protein [candidate division KSB1 bacterium]MDZ7366890.1 carboxypeptidase regulatory-like domain-containing protein [candidate division KSB1 bacterium]MDZ7406059.1 carboxypeptidase regulatory-like domain-containing protein [candidate division KSB1 bacterium]